MHRNQASFCCQFEVLVFFFSILSMVVIYQSCQVAHAKCVSNYAYNVLPFISPPTLLITPPRKEDRPMKKHINRNCATNSARYIDGKAMAKKKPTASASEFCTGWLKVDEIQKQPVSRLPLLKRVAAQVQTNTRNFFLLAAFVSF